MQARYLNPRAIWCFKAEAELAKLSNTANLNQTKKQQTIQNKQRNTGFCGKDQWRQHVCDLRGEVIKAVYQSVCQRESNATSEVIAANLGETC